MAHLLRVLCAASLLVFVIAGTALAGDAEDVDEANRLIDQANVIVHETSDLDAQAAALLSEVFEIDPAAENAADALPKLAEIQGIYAEITQKLESTAGLWGEVEALAVSEEQESYFSQKREIQETSIEFYAAFSDLMARYQVLFDPEQVAELSQAGRDALEQETTDLAAEVDRLDVRLTAMEQSANQYYVDNDLGEPAAEGRGWVGWTAYVVLGTASALACGALARRKNRNVAGWAIFGFVMPVITLIAILIVGKVERLPKLTPAAKLGGGASMKRAARSAPPRLPPSD